MLDVDRNIKQVSVQARRQETMSQDESSLAEVREAKSWYLRSIGGETETSFELFRIDILGLQGRFHPIIAFPEKECDRWISMRTILAGI